MSFEKWWERQITLPADDIGKVRAGWIGCLSEMNQPQDATTCSKGHPRWGLAVLKTRSNGPSGTIVQVCSICAEVAKVEAEREHLRMTLTRVCEIFAFYHQSDSGSDADQRAVFREAAALARKEEKPHAIQE